jgi:hypothetical protein
MATKAKKSAGKKSVGKKSAARKPAARKPAGKKSVGKKSAARKPAAGKAPASRGSGGRLAMSVSSERGVQKPRSNFCEDHDLLLRADRTCPISTCRFHTTAMP